MVGGGAVGASTAYHLAARGAGDRVLLLEVKFSIVLCRLLIQGEKLTAGTTWHSAAMLNTLRFGIIEVSAAGKIEPKYSLPLLSIVSTGKAGEPHEEAGRPSRGRDRCEPWVQGEKFFFTC